MIKIINLNILCFSNFHNRKTSESTLLPLSPNYKKLKINGKIELAGFKIWLPFGLHLITRAHSSRNSSCRCCFFFVRCAILNFLDYIVIFLVYIWTGLICIVSLFCFACGFTGFVYTDTQIQGGAESVVKHDLIVFSCFVGENGFRRNIIQTCAYNLWAKRVML